MTSPSAPSAVSSRRRQRSVRLIVATGMVALAVAAALAAVLIGSWPVAAGAAVAAAVLGAVATRITHTEVAETRRGWARDRAEQAREYRSLTEARTSEQALYVAATNGRIVRHEATIGRLEKRLADAAAEVVLARDELAVEKDRLARTGRDLAAAQADGERLGRRLDEAEERAAMAIVRVVELEQELDLAHADAAHWRELVERAPRKHA